MHKINIKYVKNQLFMRTMLINKIEEYPVIIDFEEASKAWRENKNILKDGMFSYKKEKRNCCYVKQDEQKCKKKRKIDSIFCEKHF